MPIDKQTLDGQDQKSPQSWEGMGGSVQASHKRNYTIRCSRGGLSHNEVNAVRLSCFAILQLILICSNKENKDILATRVSKESSNRKSSVAPPDKAAPGPRSDCAPCPFRHPCHSTKGGGPAKSNQGPTQKVRYSGTASRDCYATKVVVEHCYQVVNCSQLDCPPDRATK